MTRVIQYNNVCEIPQGFLSLEKNEQEMLMNWIEENITEGPSYRKKNNSYALSREFNKFANGVFFINNTIMKCAMMKSGHEPRNRKVVDWVYRVEIDRTQQKEEWKEYLALSEDYSVEGRKTFADYQIEKSKKREQGKKAATRFLDIRDKKLRIIDEGLDLKYGKN